MIASFYFAPLFTLSSRQIELQKEFFHPYSILFSPSDVRQYLKSLAKQLCSDNISGDIKKSPLNSSQRAWYRRFLSVSALRVSMSVLQGMTLVILVQSYPR